MEKAGCANILGNKDGHLVVMIINLALDIKTKNRCNKCIFSDSKFTLRAVSNTSPLIAKLLKCVDTVHKTKPSSCTGYLAIWVSIVVNIVEKKSQQIKYQNPMNGFGTNHL